MVGEDFLAPVFVYGTLLAGEYNHAIVQDSARLGSHLTLPRYTLYDTGPYPAAVANGETAISGEVYAVNPSVFRDLDRLEDYPHLYTRERIPTAYGRAWMYLWIAPIEPHWTRLAGDWRAR